MTNDIIALVDFYEREKGLSRERILQALEFAFLSAYRKMVPGANAIENLRADINTAKGKVKILADLQVVADDDYMDKFNEVPLSMALRLDAESTLGDILPVNVTPKDFGRIAVQTARQTMMQKLLDAEKVMLYDEFKDRAGEIVSGTIRRFEKGDVYVDLGKFEGLMPSRERVNTEDYSVGDRMRFYVVEVRVEARGPEVILSRSHPNLVRRLFEAEVVEIPDHTVEIRGIAREAGYRTKIAVFSNDPKVDPVGACVGMRGARVKDIVRELNNEKVDIIEWTEDPIEFVRSALSPVEPREITADPETKTVMVIVDDEKDLAKAIGRRGQNARLTSRLINWDIQVRIYDPQSGVAKQLAEAAKMLSVQLEINETIAYGLATMGGTTIAALIDFEASDIADSLEISTEDAENILEKVRACADRPSPTVE
ncbi:MAG: transcription termination factor NusA [Akkermansia sp.]